MSNNKQSSVEWFDNEIGKLFNQFIVDKITIYEFRNQQLKLKQQAKAMHKQEIIAAKDDNYVYGEAWEKLGILGEQYYNETFGE